MAPTHLLFDVNPIAITICKRGANGQRIFLKKSDDELLTLPAQHSIFKSGDDWRVFYCVVAEPDAEEDCGMGDGAGEGIVDVWKSEDEIAAAAHRLLKNKAYVNAMHDALAEEGCHIVENAVALNDIWVGGDCIKKGSWYVGIEPSPDFRAKVDSGEITGVSLEGTGFREALIQKAADKTPDAKIPNKPGKTNWLERAGGFPRYMRKVIEDLLGSHPEWLASQAGVSHAIQIGVGIVQNWAEGHDGKGGKVSAKTQAKARAAVAEWERKKGSSKVKKADPDEVAREGVRLYKQMAEETLLLKIARKVGLADDELPEELRKADVPPTFAQIIAQRELDDELPAAFSALRDSVWYAFNSTSRDAQGEYDPRELITQSLSEFQTWAIDLVDRLGIAGENASSVKKAMPPFVKQKKAAQMMAAGKSTAEIAQALSISEDAVKSMLARNKKLAKALGFDETRLPDPAGTLEDEVNDELANKILKAQEDTNSALQTLVQAITDGKLAPVKSQSSEDGDESGEKKVKKSGESDDATPITKGDLRKAMDELLVEIATGVSAQPDDDGEPEAVKKSENNSDPLKGLLD